MSYDLSAINKELDEFRMGSFSWPILLQESGAGYVLGYGAGRSPGTHVYKPDKNGASPASNDGYRVTANESKMMAYIVRGFISVQRFINKEWEDIPNAEELKKVKSYDGKPLYNAGWHEDRLKKFEEFAEWAEKSRGFSIH